MSKAWRPGRRRFQAVAQQPQRCPVTHTAGWGKAFAKHAERALEVRHQGHHGQLELPHVRRAPADPDELVLSSWSTSGMKMIHCEDEL